MNQTSLEDALKLRVPTHIVYGRFDPVVMSKNLRYLREHNPHVTLTPVLASHEIIGPFVDVAAHIITEELNNSLAKKTEL